MSTETTESTGRRFADVDGYRVLLYASVAVLAAFFLSPIESGLVTSFKTDDAITATAAYMPPLGEGFTLSNYARALDVLLRGVFNSLLFAVPATVLSALLGSFAAYGLTLVDWKYQVPLLALFVAGVFIPYQAVLVPLSRLYSIVNVAEILSFLWPLLGVSPEYADLVELVITHVAYGIPICTVLFRAYYRSMSSEMMEAARLDGASVRRMYRRIVFPLSTPMFAVVLIYQFTQIWNDLLFALVIVATSTSNAAPVTLQLAGLGASLSGLDFGLRMAGAFVAALPTLIVYIAFGDEFAEGVTT